MVSGSPGGFDAWIFDMDGLLAETESLWRVAERAAVAKLGIPLTDTDFDVTMGTRMRDVAKIWHQWHPWGDSPTPHEVADVVIDHVISLAAGLDPLPGVIAALDLANEVGTRVALCSSSDLRMIQAIVGALDIADRFEELHSAEDDEHGKPHPEPYLVTARKLGVDPRRCLVFEDSVAGCVSAKAAMMSVVAVPDPAQRGSSKFGFADVVLESMEQLTAAVVERLAAGVPVPSLSRPRFHLALDVDDLDLARHFYGTVLGCPEGRSDDRWVDFNLHGHQVVAHLVAEGSLESGGVTNRVDGQDVPARHFGVLLTPEAWDDLVARLRTHDQQFVIEPQVRFKGEVGEQRTCFFLDPAGNALEFKAFVDDSQVFAR